MMRQIGFMEGYRIMRQVGADRLASVFMAAVWFLRGDQIRTNPVKY